MISRPMRLSAADFRAIRAKSKAKKARRAEKAAENEALMQRPAVQADAGRGFKRQRRPDTTKPVKVKIRLIRALASRKTLKDAIIRLLGLLDRKKYGNSCRLDRECPVKTPHPGFLAYHLVPAQRGDATRFIPENVVWACTQANYGEVMNRSLYRDKHVRIFGQERIERLEALARETRKYSRTELYELRAKLKSELESA